MYSKNVLPVMKIFLSNEKMFVIKQKKAKDGLRMVLFPFSRKVPQKWK
jgi:hypothetical protein